MNDRARQALHLLALDPIAETKADPNSYGFRTGRAPVDAIDQAFRVLCRKGSAKWILKCDIRSCFAYTPIRRHTKIKGEANPYDPHWEKYFEQRLDAKTEGSLKGLKTLLFLWSEQEGKCPVCQERITKLTGWQTHHLIWKSHGGTDGASNLVLLHPGCHQEVHSQKFGSETAS